MYSFGLSKGTIFPPIEVVLVGLDELWHMMCRTHRTWTMDLCRRHAGEILWPSRYLITLNIKCYMDSYTQFQPYPMNLPEYLFHLIFWYVSIHTLTQQTYADHPRSGVHNPHPSIEDHSVAWHDVYSGIEFLYNYNEQIYLEILVPY